MNVKGHGQDLSDKIRCRLTGSTEEKTTHLGNGKGSLDQDWNPEAPQQKALGMLHTRQRRWIHKFEFLSKPEFFYMFAMISYIIL